MAASTALMEYLTTTKIGEKGQLTVPKEFREDLGLGTGAPFAVLRLGDGLILLPEQQRFNLLCERISSALGIAPTTPDFVKEVAISDMFEIESSKLAEQKGNAQEKSFAQQMVIDHTKTSTELKRMRKVLRKTSLELK